MLSITVPPLGESIVEATISRWLKADGDVVSSGETLVELETDKVTVEVPATKAGVLVRRMHREGDVVKVGDVLAEVDDSAAAPADRRATAKSEAPAVKGPPREPSARESEPAPRAGPAPHPAPEPRPSPAARRVALESGVDVRSVAGTGRGGVISKPDVIEYVRRSDGATTPAAPAPERAAPPSTGVSTSPPLPSTHTPAPQPDRPREVEVVRPEPPGESRPVTPARGEAPAIERPGTPAARETRERMSTRRRRIAEHLLQAHLSTAHLTTFNEIDMSAVEALRARIKERVERDHGVRLTFMPFFVRAACQALGQYPVANATIDGDEIVYRRYVNMGIAVASDAGLVVPTVKDADRKGLIQIGREIAEIAKKARDGTLTMDDLTGGTFTITNGGVFGSLLSTPIINYPQVAILGLHRILDRPVVVGGEIAIRPMMYVALSYDHRIIDGQQAVLFLVRVKELMEDPAMMVVD
jgi:2-oxoglutarate dehydrogenase E2 component (dihydrolipoamide succinyltransferase)